MPYGRCKKKGCKGQGAPLRGNGRYRYTYYIRGKQYCFYSWKLEDTDRVPSGKHPCKSLRNQIKELNKSREMGIALQGNGMSILDLVEEYLEIQNASDKIRASTKAGYKTSLKHIREDPISSIRIDKFKKSDAKKWVISLKERGFGYSTISAIHGVVKHAFRMAADDGLILKNPFDFALVELVSNDNIKRDALTAVEKASLLEFIKNDMYYSQYFDAVVILFETGLRIAEFCGLTSDKVDMENRMIKIDVQLHKDKHGYYLEKPKTAAGSRTVPITDTAYECFSHLIQNRTKKQAEKKVCGQKNYLCFDRNGMPRYGSQWDKIFEKIWKGYKQCHDTAMVKVTPHICRHTFATNMAIAGMSPVTLKQVMGHDDIFTTFSIYTHIKENNLLDEFQKLGLVNMDIKATEQVSAKDNPKAMELEGRTA